MGNDTINEIKDNYDRKIQAIEERSYPASRVIMLKTQTQLKNLSMLVTGKVGIVCKTEM